MTYIALTGIVIIAVAALLAVRIVRRHPIEQDRLVKMILFGLYFWGFLFLQLIIVALTYRFVRT